MEGKRVAFHHFGCKVNFSEASAISRDFVSKGYRLVEHHEIADLYVISSCMVTGVAEKKCRAAIRQAHRLNPSARIAVVGCFPELKPDEILAIEGVDLVLGNNAKFDLLKEVEEKLFHSETECPYPHIASPGSFYPSYSHGDRTRSFLKIQDGCDYFCSYCTIPYARGHSRSDTIEHVLEEVGEIIRKGDREIVLTGINLGDFGRYQGASLEELLIAMRTIRDLPRIRLSSIEPDLLSDGIIGLVAESDWLMPHFHIPLQSGSDRILKAMKRKYTRELFAGRVMKIRTLMPLACIAVDVIAGFPGETDEDFEETYRFLEDLPVSYFHVFSYSHRERTLAAGMQGVVSGNVKKHRSERLHLLSDRKKQAFYRLNANRFSYVLFESDHSEGVIHGFTENYCKVRTAYHPWLVNTIRKVRLTEPDEDLVFTVQITQDEP